MSAFRCYNTVTYSRPWAGSAGTTPSKRWHSAGFITEQETEDWAYERLVPLVACLAELQLWVVAR